MRCRRWRRCGSGIRSGISVGRLSRGGVELLRRMGCNGARVRQMPLVDRVVSGSDTRSGSGADRFRETLREVGALRRELAGGAVRSVRGYAGGDTVGGEWDGWRGRSEFVGLAKPREGVAEWLYAKRVRMTAAHVVEQGCELLGAAVGEVLAPAKVMFPVDEAAESWCDELLADCWRTEGLS